jgi:nitrile hydratase
VVLHRTKEKWPFPDSIGHGKQALHEPTYHVRFNARELWGEAADDGFVVVDLFEGYLDKVELPAARKDAAGLAQRENAHV